MRTGLDWYKRRPVAYLGGVQGLTAKQHAVYSVVIELVYQHGGWVNNDPRWVSGWIADMGPAAIRNTIAELVALGKLILDGDRITQHVAQNEAETQEKRRENASVSGRLGGIQSGFSRRENSKNNDIHEANALTREDKRREEGSGSGSGACAPARDADQNPPPEDRPRDDQPATLSPDPSVPDDAWALFLSVVKAVGYEANRLPLHWMPPAGTMHVARWRGLGLYDEEIIAAARHSRQNFHDPPKRPSALDAVMQNLAAAKKLPALTPPADRPARQIGAAHGQRPDRDERQRQQADIIRAAARGTT